MRKFNQVNALASASVLAALVLPVASAAAGNPFAATPIAGYQLAAADQAEGKCGGHGKGTEGTCGGKAGEGKCGEGKCGSAAKPDAKAGEGKCGEGKCGGTKKAEPKAAEGKCGEGKRGEGKCGGSRN